MQWKDIITQKNKVAIILGSVFLLVLTTTMMDKRHLSELQNSLTSVYEDRLVAKSYLSSLSKKIHQKKNLLDQDEAILFVKTIYANDSIQTLLKNYETTELTSEENLQFERLMADMNQLQLLESRYIHSTASPQLYLLKTGLKNQYDAVLSDLEKLAEIQVYEGKKMVDKSNQIIASSNLTSRLEIGVLIVLGLLINALLSSPKTILPKHPHMETLH